ncbi:ribonuclease H-like domain-containing protein [Tanacetum coccineum]
MLASSSYGSLRPVSLMSINHEKYTLVIIDEYSRYTWVYFLKKKSKAATMIMSFVKMVENQNYVKVKQIRTDNGTEFRKTKFESFCDEKGISQNFSSPYTPEQNGVAERKNRTLIEAARTMLNGLVLFKHFWIEAVRITDMDQDSAHMVAASKVPTLKPVNGNIAPKTTVVEGVEKVMAPTTAEEKAQKRLEVKARSTLMMGIPNEYQLKLNSIKDAKLLMEAVEKRFGGNATTKKTQRNLLKNKTDLDTMTMDDLYNKLKVYEPEVKGMSSSINTTNGVSAANTQVNASNIDNLSDAVICAFLASQPNNPQLAHEDLQQIHPDDLEEMDLRWQMAMLTMRARRFLKNTCRKLTIKDNESVGFDKSKVEYYNCHKKGHFAKECRVLRNQDYKNKESTRRTDWSDQEEEGPNYALMAYSSLSSDSEKSELMVLAYKSGLESVEEKLEVYKANESIYSQDIKIVDNCKKGLGYNAVPPPYTGNFMPPTPDLSFTGLDEFVNKPVIENKKFDEEVSKVVRKSNDSPIIEDWMSDSEEENVSQTKIEKKTVKPSIAKIEFVKPKQQEKTARKTVKQVEKHRQNTHSPRGNQRNWNNMMS